MSSEKELNASNVENYNVAWYFQMVDLPICNGASSILGSLTNTYIAHSVVAEYQFHMTFCSEKPSWSSSFLAFFAQTSAEYDLTTFL